MAIDISTSYSWKTIKRWRINNMFKMNLKTHRQTSWNVVAMEQNGQNTSKQRGKMDPTLNLTLLFKLLHLGRIVRVEIYAWYLGVLLYNLVKYWNISIIQVLSVFFLADIVHTAKFYTCFHLQWTLSYLTPLQFEKPLLFEHFSQSLDFQYIFVPLMIVLILILDLY